MKLYRLRAARGAESAIEHDRLSMTKAVLIARRLLMDGYMVTMYQVGEAKHTPPPIRPQPASHPWKAKPSVPQFMRRGRGA